MSAHAAAAIRLLMLTGCRRNEILELRWEDVDLDAGELRLPDGKTGARLYRCREQRRRSCRDCPVLGIARGSLRAASRGDIWSNFSLLGSGCASEPLRWSHIVGQLGGRDKVYSG